MPSYVALLRAINVAGHQTISMADLKSFAVSLGLTQVRTLLQTGNLLFDSAKKAEALAALLETRALSDLGLDTPFLMRSAADWAAIVRANPFVDEAVKVPAKLVLMPLQVAPAAERARALQAAHAGPEVIRLVGKDLYLYYPEGIGRSKLTVKKIESALGTVGTGRNWNTVLKIQAELAKA